MLSIKKNLILKCANVIAINDQNKNVVISDNNGKIQIRKNVDDINLIEV